MIEKKTIEFAEKSIDNFQSEMDKLDKELNSLINSQSGENKQKLESVKLQLNRIKGMAKNGNIKGIDDLVNNLKKQYGS